MKTEKNHRAIVRSVSRNSVEISIISDKSDCSGCAISTICNIPSEGTLVIATSTPELYTPGQEVSVRPDRGGAWKAILFLLAIPILLFVMWIALKELTGISETGMGIGILVSLIFYFAIIYFCRQPLHNKINWHITH